jgi:hypothetical protein
MWRMNTGRSFSISPECRYTMVFHSARENYRWPMAADVSGVDAVNVLILLGQERIGNARIARKRSS